MSRRNRYVAERLTDRGFGTLLFDLLTDQEDESSENHFAIPLLAHRLELAVRWVGAEPWIKRSPIALFGASTGAAAALVVAANLGHVVAGVVSRGGRPDLAGDALRRVVSPTRFIVGELDGVVLKINRESKAKMPHTTPASLEIVENATHLFEEPGALCKASSLACDWFVRYAILSTP